MRLYVQVPVCAYRSPGVLPPPSPRWRPIKLALIVNHKSHNISNRSYQSEGSWAKTERHSGGTRRERSLSERVVLRANSRILYLAAVMFSRYAFRTFNSWNSNVKIISVSIFFSVTWSRG